MRRAISKTSGRISCADGDRYIFDFSVAGSTLARQGNDLILKMQDGQEIVFGNFYAIRRASFVMDDQEVQAKEFFAALDAEHLAPAMGPAPSSPAQQGNDHSSHHSWETMSALEGIWHLDGLDIFFETSREPQEVSHENLYIAPDGAALGQIRLEAPAVDIADEASPDQPAIIHFPAGAEVVSVACKGPGRVERLPNGDLAYYPEPIDSGDVPGRNEVEGGSVIEIVLRKPDGTTETFEVPVTIRDDVPEAHDDAVEGEKSVSGNVLANDSFGADGPHDREPIRWPDTKGEHGELIVDKDGNWTYTPDPGFRLPAGETVTETFEYIIKDKDGDESHAWLTITIKGTDHPVSVTPENPADSGPDPDVPDIPSDPENPVRVPPDAKISAVSVSEKDLGDGSAKDSDSFIIDAPDGVAKIEIGGETVYEDGKLTGREIETDEGRIVVTGFDPDTGRLTYEFILERPTGEHEKPGEDAISHTFEVKVTDPDGSKGVSYIRVIITDDTPEANPDLATASGNAPIVSGNVADNDDYGADGPGRIEWQDAEPKYGRITLKPDGSYEYELNPDLPEVKGLIDGESVTEEFRYTIIDADGDESEAVLVIRIEGRDDGVTVTPENPVIPDPETPDIPIGGGDPLIPGVPVSRVEVHEARLSEGKVSAVGAFDIDAPDGLSSVAIAGVAVWTKDGGLADNPVIPTDEGRLVITGFDGGRLTYEFMLDRATSEHSGQGRDAISHSFAITATDRDGSEGIGHISVRIIDDVPQAKDDLSEISEGRREPVSGNVFDNDESGADRGAFESWLDEPASKYGVLTLGENGEWAFVLDRTNPEVMRLKDGESLEEHFRYQVRDADGDTSEAVLTIRISGKDNDVSVRPRDPNPEIPDEPGQTPDPNDPATQGSGGRVSEKDIDPDNPPVVKGKVDIDSPDGIGKITVGGEEIPTDGTPKDIEGPHGTITVTFIPDPDESGKGTLEYEYRLEKPADHPEDEPVFDDFPVDVADPDGDSGRTLIRIGIIDDEPVASDDYGRLNEDEDILVGSVSVLENDAFGADGPAKTDSLIWDNLSENRIEGKYGWLEPAEGGRWTYHLDRANPDVRKLSDGENLEDSFAYRITDADGDTSEATLRIRIDGVNHDVTVIPRDPDPEIPNEPGKTPDPDDPATQGSGGKLSEKDIDPDNPPSVKKTVDIESPDGVERITVENEEIPTDGTPKEIGTPHGRIVVTFIPDPDDPGKGSLEYEYFLEKPAEHPEDGPVLEDIPVEVTDPDGDSAKTLIRIEIIDDIPVARDDYAEISEGEISVSSNASNAVLNNDDFGADGRAPEGFLRWEGGLAGKYGALKPNADGSWTYELDPANRAVMELSEGQSLDDERFAYVIRDADGSESTAWLHIKINGVNNPVNITPKPEDGDPDVPPKGGSDNPHDVYAPGSGTSIPESAIGTEEATVTRRFELSVPDGIDKITVEGREIGEEPIHIDGPHGDLIVKFIPDPDNPGKGILEYSYTLTDPANHEDGPVSDSFELVVTDTDGSKATSEIRIDIRDDKPQAENDAESITEGQPYVAVDFLKNDDYGKDGPDPDNPVAFERLAGDWGELRLVDGEWRYYLDNGNPEIRGMRDGDKKTDAFTYTIKDSDGSEATATITITIKGQSNVLTVTPGPGEGADFDANAFNVDAFEKHLPDGTEKDEALLEKSGYFEITAEAGVSGITLADVALTHEYQEIPTGWGEFSARMNGDGNVEWKYRLDGKKVHADGEGRNAGGETLALIVTDNEGKSVDAFVKISVEDDIPLVLGTRNEGGLSGSIDLKFGADGPAETPFDGFERTDAGWQRHFEASDSNPAGILLIHDDNTWEFTPDNGNLNFRGALAFDAIDSDQDHAPISLEIIRSLDPEVINTDTGAHGADMNLGSFAIDEGENPVHGGEAHGAGTGSFAVNLHGDDGVINFGDLSIEIRDGQAEKPEGSFKVNGIELKITDISEDNGVWTIDYSYAYSEGEGQAHAGENLSGEIAVSVTSGGKSATGAIYASLHDDAPNPANDEKPIGEGDISVSGNVHDNDADGADSGFYTIIWEEKEGVFGDLAHDGTGAWTYVLHGDDPAIMKLRDGESETETFNYILRDADGTERPATLTITINGRNHGIEITPNPEPEDPDIPPSDDDDSDIDNLHAKGSGADLHEKDLADGDVSVTRTISIEAKDGLASVVVSKNGESVDLLEDGEGDLDGEYGGIHLSFDKGSGALTWTYTLSENADHSENDALNDDFALVVTDIDGSRADSIIRSIVHDDAPEAREDAGSIEEGEVSVLSDHSVLYNDTEGADRSVTLTWRDGQSDTAGTVLEGKYGRLELRGDGEWEYFLNNAHDEVRALTKGAALEDEFAYTITDTDGDPSSSKLVITIRGVDNGVKITPKEPDPDLPGDPEKDIDPADPSTMGTSNAVSDKSLRDGAAGDVREGVFEIDAPDGLKSVELNETAIGTEPKDIPGSNGTLTAWLVQSESDAAKYELRYRYQFTKHGEHPIDQELVNDEFSVLVTDADGSTAKSRLFIKISDDEPEAHDDAQSVTEGRTEPLTGKVEHAFGGDGKADSDYLVWNETEARYGTIELRPDGSYTYVLDNGNQSVLVLKEGDEPLVEIFSYTVKDADGDTKTATLTITITGTDGAPEITPNVPESGLDPDDPDLIGEKREIWEKNFAEGNDPDTDALVKSGSMTVSTPDGAKSVVVEIGGQSLALAELQEDGSYRLTDGRVEVTTRNGSVEGFLEVSYEPDGLKSGVINYKFTLQNPEKHGASDDISWLFRLIVTELDGDPVTAGVLITVKDDEPRVVDTQEGTVTEGAEGEDAIVSGNALGMFATGADIHENKADGFEWAVSEELLAEIRNYGVINLDGDTGEWTFTLNSDLPTTKALTEAKGKDFILDCRYTDADGDSVDGFVTLHIKGVSSGITLTPKDPNLPPDDPETPDNPYVPESPEDPDRPEDKEKDPDPDDPYNPSDPNWGAMTGGDAIARVFESGLGEGTEAGSRNTRAHGAILVDAPDGLKELSVSYGGETRDLLSESPAIAVMDGEREIGQVILSWNAEKQQIDYSFRLTGVAEHGKTGFDAREFELKIDAKNNSDEPADIRLVLQVIDDRPIACDDNGGTVSEENVLAQGNVIADSDEYGADGKAAVDSIVWKDAENGVIQGKYGMLTLGEDGNWTYELDKDSEAVLKLKDGQIEREEFFYTIRDADGDESTAKLTINVEGKSGGITIEPNDPDTDVDGDPGDLESHGASAALREKDLDDGTGDPKDALTKADFITIASDDGIAKMTLGGQPIGMDGTEQEISVSQGKLFVRYEGDIHGGKLHYRFELDRNYGHDKKTADELLREELKLIVTDFEDKAKETTLRLDIQDDAPLFGEVVKDGNVEIVGEMVADTMTFHVQWGADCRHETTPFIIANATQLEITDTGMKFRWDGSDGSPSGIIVIDFMNEVMYEGLANSGDYRFSFIPDESGAECSITFNFVITDTDEPKRPGPETTIGQHLESVSYPDDTSGIFALSFGADGPDAVPFTIEDGIGPTSFEDSAYVFEIKEHSQLPDGTLTVSMGESGKWTYSFEPANANLNFSGEITLNAIDGDKDSDSVTLSFSRSLPPYMIDKSGDEDREFANIALGEAVVDEGGQPYHEEEAHPSQSSFGINMRGEDGIIRFGDIEIAIADGGAVWNEDASYETKGVKLTVLSVTPDGDGRWIITYGYEYVAEGGQPHPDAIISDKVAIDVTLKSGLTVSGWVTAVVHDDVPLTTPDGNSISEGDIEPATGNVLTNDSYGKDGEAAADSLIWKGLYDGEKITTAPSVNEAGETVIEGVYGHFVVRPDGSYDYFLNNDDPAILAMTKDSEPFTEQVQYVIKDGDGDTKVEYLTITINGKSGEITIDPEKPDSDVPGMPGDMESHGASEKLYEENLEKGNAPDESALMKEGRIEIKADDGVKEIRLGATVIEKDGEWHDVDSQYGSLVARYVGDIRGGWLEYRYSLDAVETHSDKGGPDSLSETLTLKVTNFENESRTSSVKLTVVDDVPVFGETIADNSYPVGILPLYSYNYRAQLSLNPNPPAGSHEAGHSGEFSERGLIRFKDPFGFTLKYEDQQILIEADTDSFELGPISFHRFENDIWDYFIDISKIDEKLSDRETGDYRAFAFEIIHPDFETASFEIEGQLTEYYYGDHYSIRTEDGSREFVCYHIPGTGNSALYVDECDEDGRLLSNLKIWEIENAGSLTSEEIYARQALFIFGEALKMGIEPELGNGSDGSFALSFGADGMNGIPFIVEDDINFKPGEDGAYVFEIKDHAGLPDGTLTISELGENWKYSFTPDDANLNYDFDLKLTAVDGDGDKADTTLHFSKASAPTISNSPGSGEFDQSVAVDEGDRPYHDGSHANAGSKSFVVNMHGDDGTISFGDITITIEDGEAAPDKASFTTENGITITLGNIVQSNGVWTINYSYAHTGAAQSHDKDASDDILVNDITITAASASGAASGIISGEVHDDIPTISDPDPETGELGEMLTGTIALSFGRDGAGSTVATLDGVSAKSIGENLWTFNLADHPTLPDGTINFTKNGDHYDYSYLPLDPDTYFDSIEAHLTIYDGDGDTAETTLTFARPAPVPVATGQTATLSLHDAETIDGISTASQTIHAFDRLSANAKLSFVDFDGIEVGGLLDGDRYTWRASGNTLIGRSQNGHVITIVAELEGNDVKLTASIVQAALQADDSLSVSGITVRATQSGQYGDAKCLSVTIDDTGVDAQPDYYEISSDHGAVISSNVVRVETQGEGETQGEDTPGADDYTVVWAGEGDALKGKFGTFTHHDDGSWTYELDTQNATIMGLGKDQSETETFGYILRDKDGNESQSSLTITINGREGGFSFEPGDGDTEKLSGGQMLTTVYEKYLENGTEEDPSKTIQSGSVIIHADHGIRELTGVQLVIPDWAQNDLAVNDTNGTLNLANFPAGDTPLTIESEYGTWEITKTRLDAQNWRLDWTFELTGTKTHKGGAEGTANFADFATLNEFRIQVTDNGGQTALQTIRVDAIDDGPKATLYTYEIWDYELGVFDKNVFSDVKFGADGKGTVPDPLSMGSSSSKWGSGSLGRFYGSTDGSGEWHYEVDDYFHKLPNLAYGDSLTDTISYTIKDAEGDTATDKIKIIIKGSGRPLVISGPATAEAYEGGLEDGQSGGSAAGSGSFVIRPDISGKDTILNLRGENGELLSFRIPAGSDSFDFGGNSIVINHAEFFNFSGTYDAIAQRWTISYDYELRDAQNHYSGATDEQISKSLIVEVTNDAGISHSANGMVIVHDDVPTIDVSNEIGVEQVNGKTHVSGYADLDFGADDGESRQLFMTFDQAGVPTSMVAAGELQADGHTWIFDFGDIRFSLDENTGDWITVESHKPLYGDYRLAFNIIDSDGDLARAQTVVSVKTGTEMFYGFFQEAGYVGHNISQEVGAELGVENIANWVITDNSADVLEGRGQFANSGAISLKGAYANHTWTNCGTGEKSQSQLDIALDVNISDTESVWYVIPADGDKVALTADMPANGMYYSALTLVRQGDGVKYSFDLNEGADLVNAMSEGEKISLYFTIQQDGGEEKILNFDIRGSNDAASASFSKIQSEIQDGLCNQDSYSSFYNHGPNFKWPDSEKMNIKDGPDGQNLENTFLHDGHQLGIYQIGGFADPDRDAFNVDDSFNGQLSIKKYYFDETWNRNTHKELSDSMMDNYPSFAKKLDEYDNFTRIKWTLNDLDSFRQYRDFLGEDYMVSDGGGLLPAGEYIRFDLWTGSSDKNRSWPQDKGASAYVDVSGKVYVDVSVTYQGVWHLDAEIFDAHGTSTVVPFEHRTEAAHEAPSFAEFPDMFTVKDSAVGDAVIGNAKAQYVYGIRNSGTNDIYYIVDENGDLVTELQCEYGLLKIDSETGQMTFDPNRYAALKKYDPDAASPDEMIGIDRYVKEFTLALKDSLGAVDTKQITVVIAGTNEAPTIVEKHLPSHILEEAGVDPINTPDAGKPVVSGTVHADDADKQHEIDYVWTVGGMKSQLFPEPQGQFTHYVDTAYGRFYHDNEGHWEFRLDNSLEAVNSLPRGEHRYFRATVRVEDEHGAFSKSKSFYIFVVGENDQPYLNVEESDLMATIQGGEVVGQVQGTDDDSGETEKLVYMFSENGELAQSVQTEIGTLVMRSPESGEFVFLLDMHSELVQRAYVEMLPHWEDGMDVLPFSATGKDWHEFVREFCEEKGIDLSNLATVRGTDPFGAYFETQVGIRDIPPIQLIPEEIKPVPVGLSWLQIELDEYDVYGKDAEKHYSDSSDIDIAQIVMEPGAAPIDYEDGILSNIAWSFVKTDGPAPECGYVTHVGLGKISGSFQSITTKYGVLEINHETGALKFTLDINNPELQDLMQDGQSQKLNLSDILADLDGYGILAYHTDMYSQNSITWFTDQAFGDGDPLLWIHDVNVSPSVTTPMPVIFIDQDETEEGFTLIDDPDSLKSGMDYEVYIDGARQKVVVNEAGFTCETMYGLMTFARNGQWSFTADGTASRALAEGESALINMRIDVLDQKTGTKQNSTDLSFLINGINDAPVALNEQVIELEDDAHKGENDWSGICHTPKVQTGTLSAFDYDVTDSLSYSLVSISGNDNGEWGGFNLKANGAWTFVSSGKSLKDEIFTATVDIIDTNGATTRADYAFIIKGVNDAPFITSGTIVNPDGFYNLDNVTFSLSKNERVRGMGNFGSSGAETLYIHDLDDSYLNITTCLKYHNQVIEPNMPIDIGYATLIYYCYPSSYYDTNSMAFYVSDISDDFLALPRETYHKIEGLVLEVSDGVNVTLYDDFILRNRLNHDGNFTKQYDYEGVENIPTQISDKENICIFTYHDIDRVVPKTYTTNYLDCIIGKNSNGNEDLDLSNTIVKLNEHIVNLNKTANGVYECYLTDTAGTEAINIGILEHLLFDKIYHRSSVTNFGNMALTFTANENYHFANSDVLQITTRIQYYNANLEKEDVSIIFHPGAPELNGTDDPDVANGISPLSDDIVSDIIDNDDAIAILSLETDSDIQTNDETQPNAQIEPEEPVILLSSEPLSIKDAAPDTLAVITGENAESIESLEDIGLTIEEDAIRLDESAWKESEDGSYANAELNLTLQKAEDAEVVLAPSEEADTEAGYLVDDTDSLDELVGADDSRQQNDEPASLNANTEAETFDIEQAIRQVEDQQG